MRRLLILALTCCFCTDARPQSKAIVQEADGSVTIDASRINGAVPLDALWRFSPDNDPRFSDPSFDDSAWPQVKPVEDQRLTDAHLPKLLNGGAWMRLHLHVLNPSTPLAFTIRARAGEQYAVFANGQQIAASGSLKSRLSYAVRPFPIYFPPGTTSAVLALHIAAPQGGELHYVPLDGFEIGQPKALSDQIDLERYRKLFEGGFTLALLGTVSLTLVPVTLVLFFAKRSSLEYLWLALVCLFGGIDLLYFPGSDAGLFPTGNTVYNFILILGTIEDVFFAEFVSTIAGLRRKLGIRILQAAYILDIISSYALPDSTEQALSLCIGLYHIILITWILISAYRRGIKEAGLLIVTVVMLPVSAMLGNLEVQFPKVFGLHWNGNFFGIAVESHELFILLNYIALACVILYRFIRISKAEEAAAAELEAARTVQQLLIPSTAPATPGFTVESVYLPARQVGGDFFLILPAPDPAADPSLLAVIGDVSGKGLQAAMVVSTIIGGLRMQLSRKPAELLAQLNRILTGNVSGFATCCAILLHPDGRAILSNAGNPSPYCNGEEIPTSPGLPLGLASEVTYDESTFTLAPGSRLSFVSDGVVEATSFPGKELFGFDRTRAISTQSAAAIAEAACAFGIGAPQADDITVLTLALESSS